MNTASNVEIIPPEDAQYTGLTFSRDGDYVYYISRPNNSPEGTLYQVPALGGSPRKLIGDVDTSVSFSPDGKQLAFIRNEPGTGESWLVVANADGTGERKLATRTRPDFFPISQGNEKMGPAWSPDGKVIACVIASADQSGRYHEIATLSLSDGTLKPLTSRRWYQIRRLSWLADGSGVMTTAAENASASLSHQVWLVSYPEGSARKITNDLNNYRGMSLTADAHAFVTVQVETVANIWVAPGGDAAALTQITTGGNKSDGVGGLSWTPDGRVVYQSTASGSADIWIMNADGSGQKQLTLGAGANYNPSVSPDGRSIAFVSERTGSPQIWRMGIDGSAPSQLTREADTPPPSWSPDGRWLLYTAGGRIWKVSADGGEPARLTDKATRVPTISPDGKFFSCFYQDTVASPYQFAVYPFEGGQPLKRFDRPPTSVGFRSRWSFDGRALQYVDTRGGVSNIWEQPIEGGPPRQLTNFKSDRIFSFDFSRDGKQLVLSRGSVTSDVVLISDAK